MKEQNGVTKLRWYDGLTSYHWLVLVVASLGWAFDTMDQWLYVLARQPAMMELLQVTDAKDPSFAKYSGIVQAVFLFGWATGGFVFGMIGDRWGRTRTMIATVLIYAGFTGMCGLAQTWWQFGIFRFLTGFGVGGEFAAGAALVAEVFPEHARTAGLGIMQAASALGNITAGIINLTIGASPHLGWRWMFFVGVLPALLTLVIRMRVKEPERWQQAKASAKSGGVQLGTIQDLFTNAEMRRRTLVGVALAAVGVIGFWGIATWSPDLLRGVLNPAQDPALKAAVERKVSYAIMGQNAGAFFGILVWAVLAQRFGRRPAFLLSFLACAAVIPTTFYVTKSFAIALIMFPAMGFVATSLFGGYAIYFPELYPTRLRATGTGFCYNVARYLAIAGPYTFGKLRGIYSIQQAALIVSSVFLLGVLALRWAPETKGQPLPE
jgi:MFS family permease